MTFLKDIHKLLIYLGCSTFGISIVFGMFMGYQFLYNSGMNLWVILLLGILSLYFFLWFFIKGKMLLLDYLFEENKKGGKKK